MASTDEVVLKYAGALGHQFVVVRGKDGDRSAGLETDSLDRARDYATQEAGERNPAIYRRSAKGWKRTA